MLDVILNESQLKSGEDLTSICEKGFQDIININYGQLDLERLTK